MEFEYFSSVVYAMFRYERIVELMGKENKSIDRFMKSVDRLLKLSYYDFKCGKWYVDIEKPTDYEFSSNIISGKDLIEICECTIKFCKISEIESEHFVDGNSVSFIEKDMEDTISNLYSGAKYYIYK